MSLQPTLNFSDEWIEIKIRSGNKTIHKAVCCIYNKKELAKILSFLKIKFGIDSEQLMRENKHKNWFQ